MLANLKATPFRVLKCGNKYPEHHNIRCLSRILHHENHVFDSKANRTFNTLNCVLLIKDPQHSWMIMSLSTQVSEFAIEVQLHELCIGLQPSKGYIHNWAVSVLGLRHTERPAELVEPLDHWDTALRLWSSRSFQFQEVHIAKDQVYEDIQECHTSTSGNKYLGWLTIQHNWVASEFQTCQFYAWNGLKAAPANPGHTIKTPILFFSLKHLSNNTNLVTSLTSRRAFSGKKRLWKVFSPDLRCKSVVPPLCPFATSATWPLQWGTICIFESFFSLHQFSMESFPGIKD